MSDPSTNGAAHRDLAGRATGGSWAELISPGRQTLVAAAALVAITLVAYVPAMRAGFVWDDGVFLTDNPLIRAADGLYRFWFTTEAPDYFPLVSSSLWLEWRLWGLHAAGYHVVNVCLHAISAVLLWRVLRRLGVPGAWLAGAVFAVHPVNVESVAWITERKNTLPMVLYLLSLLAYLQFDKDGRHWWYALALGAFLCALLSKTSVVMLPIVLLGCAWWLRGRISRADLLRAAPFALLSLLFGVITVWFQYHRAIRDDIVRTDGLLSRLAVAGCAVWFYLYKAVLPRGLALVYPRWSVDAASLVSYLPALAVAVCLALFWRHRRGWGRPWLAGFGYYVVTLLPVLGFVNIYLMRYSLVADHWQYTAIAGVIALVIGGGAWVVDRHRVTLFRPALALAALTVTALALLTWRQAGLYKDAETIWLDTIAKNPGAWVAYANLGDVRESRGDLEGAIRLYRNALAISPGESVIHYALGNALGKQHRNREAIASYRKAVELDPKRAGAHLTLAVALAQEGLTSEAIDHCRAVLAVHPSHVGVHNSLALLLDRNGQFDEAVQHYSEAIRIKPGDAVLRNNLGIALARRGRLPEAADCLRAALSLDPRNANTHNYLGRVLIMQNRPKEAIEQLEEALRLRPDFPEARENLLRARKQLPSLDTQP